MKDLGISSVLVCTSLDRWQMAASAIHRFVFNQIYPLRQLIVVNTTGKSLTGGEPDKTYRRDNCLITEVSVAIPTEKGLRGIDQLRLEGLAWAKYAWGYFLPDDDYLAPFFFAKQMAHCRDKSALVCPSLIGKLQLPIATEPGRVFRPSMFIEKLSAPLECASIFRIPEKVETMSLKSDSLFEQIVSGWEVTEAPNSSAHEDPLDFVAVYHGLNLTPLAKFMGAHADTGRIDVPAHLLYRVREIFDALSLVTLEIEQPSSP